MKYAAEHAGVLTSVHQWKPIPPERFAQLLHHYTTALCDRHGHEGISHTSVILDRDATATVFYRPKEREHPVSSPALMTMEGPAGKVLCFETTNADFALEPKAAAQVIQAAAAFHQKYRDERLKVVARAAVSTPKWVVVVTPREDDYADVRRAIEAARGDGANIRYVTATGLSNIRRDGAVSAIWLHNPELIGGAALNTVMHEIADIMCGRGWLGMTGYTPSSWTSPDGLPKDRV